MKNFTSPRIIIVLCAILSNLCAGDTRAAPIDTSISYQGVLEQGGVPANGEFDFEFTLYADGVGGSPFGPTVSAADVTVGAGLFTVELDFGDVFNSDTALWMEIEVREGASTGVFTTLVPRQPILATPYSRHATHSDIADEALQAEDADLLDGLDSSEFIGTDGGYLTGGLDVEDTIKLLLPSNILQAELIPDVDGLRVRSAQKRIFLDSDEVGVGVSNPSQVLDVAGAVRIGNTVTGAGGSIRWTGSDIEGFNGAWTSLTSTDWDSISNKPTTFPPSGTRSGNFNVTGDLDVFGVGRVRGDTEIDGDLRIDVNSTSSPRLFLGGLIQMESFYQDSSRIELEGHDGSTARVAIELEADEFGGELTLFDGDPTEVPNTINQTVFLDGRSSTGGGRIIVRDGLNEDVLIDLNAADTYNALEMALIRVNGGIVVSPDAGSGGFIETDLLIANDYVQLDHSSGTPPSGDCANSSHWGRMRVDATAGLLYICVSSGWISK